MWVEADDIILCAKNNKKEDTMMNTNKKAKLTFIEAMTIINNASTENKIEITDDQEEDTYYVIKIDDTNYIVYAPDDTTGYINIVWICNKIHINKKDVYNFTVVANSPNALLNLEGDIHSYIEDGYYYFLEGFNINVDIIYDMIDTPNKIELDDKKARKMLTKARFTGCLYELFGGYGYTINNNNVIWYIPDDYYLNDEDINKRPYYMMYDEGSNSLDGDFMKNKISLNIYAISNKKVFDTDFIICINDSDKDQNILAYVHTNITNDTACQK